MKISRKATKPAKALFFYFASLRLCVKGDFYFQRNSSLTAGRSPAVE
jgi:hypothetical protein